MRRSDQSKVGPQSNMTIVLIKGGNLEKICSQGKHQGNMKAGMWVTLVKAKEYPRFLANPRS